MEWGGRTKGRKEGRRWGSIGNREQREEGNETTISIMSLPRNYVKIRPQKKKFS